MSPRHSDLVLVVVLTVTASLAILVQGVPWRLKWALGVPFLLVLPGYAVVSALFPTRPTGDESGPPDWPARLGLTLLSSALLVAIVGYLLLRQGVVPFSLTPVVILLAGVTLLGVGIAANRRSGVPKDRVADPLAGASTRTVSGTFGTTGVQSIAVVLSVVVLAGALGFAGAAPASQPHSEVYLTGGDDVDIGPTNGTQTLTAGDSSDLALAIGNHEAEPMDYRVVTEVQRLNENGRVLDRERLDDFRVGIGAEQTEIIERSLEPTLTGENLRLRFRVFKMAPGGTANVEAADLTLRSWVTVVRGGRR